MKQKPSCIPFCFEEGELSEAINAMLNIIYDNLHLGYTVNCCVEDIVDGLNLATFNQTAYKLNSDYKTQYEMSSYRLSKFDGQHQIH